MQIEIAQRFKDVHISTEVGLKELVLVKYSVSEPIRYS